MNEYFIEINFPTSFDDDFKMLIPRQRDIIELMIDKGIIVDFAVSLDDGKMWVAIIAGSENDARDMIKEFPIYRFITYKIHKISLHKGLNFAVPQFSLN